MTCGKNTIPLSRPVSKRARSAPSSTLAKLLGDRGHLTCSVCGIVSCLLWLRPHPGAWTSESRSAPECRGPCFQSVGPRHRDRPGGWGTVVRGSSEETPGWRGKGSSLLCLSYSEKKLTAITTSYTPHFSSKSLLGLDIVWLVMRPVKRLVLIMAIGITNME